MTWLHRNKWWWMEFKDRFREHDPFTKRRRLEKTVNIVIELQNIFQIMARVLTQCSDEWAIEKYHIMYKDSCHCIITVFLSQAFYQWSKMHMTQQNEPRT